MTTAYSNRSRVSVATTGTGTVSLGSALVNFKDLSSLTSGSTIGYALDDLSTGGWEVGTGVYTSGSPSTVTRATIETSTNSGSAISLSGNATLMVTVTAAEMSNLTAGDFGGINFGSVYASSPTDLSKHIALYGSNVGLSVTSTRLNYEVPSGAIHAFQVNGSDVADIDLTGFQGVIGGTTPAAGHFTTLSANTSATAPTPAQSDNSTNVATTAFVAPAFNNFGRNKLHNPLFNIQQRGTGAWTSGSSYTADRWQLLLNGDSDSVSIVTLGDSDRSAIGDEEAIYCLSNAFTGVNSAADYSLLLQKIESVNRLSNKTVSVSFWAKANSGTPKVGVSLDQFFGTSGSPSSTVTGTGVSTAISTTWTRYSFANISMPSVSGKTLGTDGDDCTYANIWFSSGSTNATRSGTVGVQSSTISLWGVQLEIAAVSSPLEKLHPSIDLANCQRFYIAGNAYMAGYGITSTPMSTWIAFPVTQRGGAGYSVTSTTSTNCSSASSTQAAPGGFAWTTTVTSTGNAASGGYWAASADL